MHRTFDRDAVLAAVPARGRGVIGPYTTAVDVWLGELFAERFDGSTGVALVATGGHGRRELTPGSDLDLLLVHTGRIDPDLASSLWYPIWDSKMKLGHAMRSVAGTLGLARTDLATATSLLSVRHLAGDPALSGELAHSAARQWERRSRTVLAELADAVRMRHRRCGDIAFELEPDLKDGRGGLRDVTSIEWAMAALPGLDPSIRDSLDDPHGVLLDARVEMHRPTVGQGNRLNLQDQDCVARRLGDADADVLMAKVAAAGRAIAWASDEIWDDIRSELGRGRRRRESETDLGHGIVSTQGKVRIRAGVTIDELTPLRVALAAATMELPISRDVLGALRAAPRLPDPWPPAARELFVQLLACGRSSVAVIESLDHVDVWTALLPEWAPTRSRPQRNAYHRFTVDRHLLEATAEAAALAARVERPDLLLVGALLHDIGKGAIGKGAIGKGHAVDHTVVGREIAGAVATRLGFDPNDVEVIRRLVELHLLLPDVATRRDLDDPVTIRTVAAQVSDVTTLDLLWALTEADATATGPAAWSSWKAELVAELVARTRRLIEGAPVTPMLPAQSSVLDERELVARCRRERRPLVSLDGDRLTVAAPDRPALFSRIAGVLALHGLDVREATVRSADGTAVDRFRIQSTFDNEVCLSALEADLDRAVRGRLAIGARLRDRAHSYRRGRTAARSLDPLVRVLADASVRSTVVEVVGADSVGLLYRLTRTLAEMDLDIVSAKVATMSNDVIDTFYVRTRDGSKVTSPGEVDEIRVALLEALSL